MKKCPFCAEEIQDEAVICRYCGRELTQLPKETESIEPQNPDAVPLNEVIFKYVSNGYVITQQNEESVQLVKNKRFPVFLLIIAIPAFLYNLFLGLSVMGVATIVWYLSKDESIYLSKRSDGYIVSTDQNGKKIKHKKSISEPKQ